MDGNQVPQELVAKIGETFEVILEEASQFIWYIEFSLLEKQIFWNTLLFWFILSMIPLIKSINSKDWPCLMQTNKVRDEFSEDMSILRALKIVFERKPELRSLLAYAIL